MFPIDEVQEDDETVVFGGLAKGGGHPATHLPPLMSRDENGGVIEPVDEDDEWQDVDIRYGLNSFSIY